MFLLAVVLAAASPKLLVMPLEHGNALSDDAALAVSDVVTDAVSKNGHFDVVSADDLRRLATLEADKQASGCDSASCLAELGQAMGARYVVFGRVTKLGEKLVLQVNVVDVTTAQVLGRETAEADREGDLARAARTSVARALAGVKEPGLRSDTQASASLVPWAELGGSVALAGVAIGTAVIGDGIMRDPATSGEEKSATQGGGITLIIVATAGALVCGALGIVGLATGGA